MMLTLLSPCWPGISKNGTSGDVPSTITEQGVVSMDISGEGWELDVKKKWDIRAFGGGYDETLGNSDGSNSGVYGGVERWCEIPYIP